ncbi:MAG: hypothetical protein ACE14L_01160 [Terriglobales bacterium]
MQKTRAVPRGNSRSAQVIVAKGSCRADLAGSTLDLWPLYLFHPGTVTLNFALDIMTTCRIERRRDRVILLKSRDTGREEQFANLEELCRAKSYRHPIGAYLVRYFAPEDGLTLETHSEAPAGAGISGSSALMVSTTAALARFVGVKMGKEQIRELAQNVEAQIIKVPTGCQDYYPALYGGINAIHLDTDGIHREAVAVAPREIEARFLLVYTGAPRQSGINNWEVFKRHINGDRKVIRNFDNISRIAQSMHLALVAGDWDDVARLLAEEWHLRRANYPGISTPLLELLVKTARKHGGRAAKVCGAGGGGCAIFMVEPEAKERVAKALNTAGGQLLPFHIERQGLTVTATAAAGGQ